MPAFAFHAPCLGARSPLPVILSEAEAEKRAKRSRRTSNFSVGGGGGRKNGE